MVSMLNNLCIFLYCRVKAFAEEERGAVDIVAVVVLIGIAVALAVLFRTQIEGILNSLFESITGGVNEAVG